MIKCNIDGSITINPGGEMGIGVIIMEDGKELFRIHRQFESVKSNSNNLAEYLALIECLNWLIELDSNHEEILIESDSMMLVMQCNKKWKIKRNIIKGYTNTAIKVQEVLKRFSNMRIEWIPREQNEIADELSKVKIKS